jgi:hypothetical protein
MGRKYHPDGFLSMMEKAARRIKRVWFSAAKVVKSKETSNFLSFYAFKMI